MWLIAILDVLLMCFLIKHYLYSYKSKFSTFTVDKLSNYKQMNNYTASYLFFVVLCKTAVIGHVNWIVSGVGGALPFIAHVCT